jgi:fimbrial isopeptide formation D2 family protein/LPXTG-motif cell wall-anchored protein
MKRVKKFLSLFMAAIMVLAMAAVIPANADEATYTITLNGAQPGHTYTAYRIFVGTVAKNSTQLGTPITWADDTKGASLLAKLKAESETKLINSTTGKNYFAEATSAEDVAKEMNSLVSEAMNRFAQLADEEFGKGTGISGTVGTGDTTVEIKGLKKGYYLIKDTTSDDNLKSDDKTRLIMNVASAETVTLKVDTTTLEKKVALGLNDTYTKGQKAEIGQKVYFELIANLPATVADYKSYQLVFHDKLPAGLTYNKIEAVYMTTKDKTNDSVCTISNYTYRSNSTVSGYTFDVAIGDLIGNSTYYGYLGDDDNMVLIVKYSAYLNENAITTSAGNLNTAKLSYTNDPSSDAITDLTSTDPGGKTPEEYAKVFTYKLAGTKVDASNTDTKLPGAEFVIYKKVEGVEKYLTEDYLDSDNHALGKGLVWTATSAADAKVFTSGADDGTFTITGLAEGVYYLKETCPPTVNGKVYSLLAKDLEIHVDATVSDVADVGNDRSNVAQTTALTAKEVSNGETALTIDEDKTTISINVQNGAGNSLPTTGGMGTTIFYILGAILVVGSAVLLIVRKRMSVER